MFQILQFFQVITDSKTANTRWGKKLLMASPIIHKKVNAVFESYW